MCVCMCVCACMCVCVYVCVWRVCVHVCVWRVCVYVCVCEREREKEKERETDIYLQGTLGWPLSYHLNGDIHKLASPRAKANQTALEETMRQGLKMDVLWWDVCNLPMRTASIDVVITDLVSFQL